MKPNDDQALEAKLQRLQRIFSGGPLQKLFRLPLRMAWSRHLVNRARRGGAPVLVQGRTFWGDPITLSYPENMSACIHRYGFLEAGLSMIVLRKLKPGMIFFDVGAHVGYFTLLAAFRVGDTGQVHSFEPSVATFQLLQKNVGQRSFVHLNQCAVYSRSTTLPLTDYGNEHSAFNTLAIGNLNPELCAGTKPVVRDVAAISIDEYVERSGARPNFVKIDAEGAEAAILEGMTNTLEKIRPLISLEVGDDLRPDRPAESRVLLETVLARAYDAMEFDSATGELRPHVLKDRYGYDNILLVPR